MALNDCAFPAFSVERTSHSDGAVHGDLMQNNNNVIKYAAGGLRNSDSDSGFAPRLNRSARRKIAPASAAPRTFRDSLNREMFYLFVWSRFRTELIASAYRRFTLFLEPL